MRNRKTSLDTVSRRYQVFLKFLWRRRKEVILWVMMIYTKEVYQYLSLSSIYLYYYYYYYYSISSSTIIHIIIIIIIIICSVKVYLSHTLYVIHV